MPKRLDYERLKVRQKDEVCDYCYYNRLTYVKHNATPRSVPYDFEPFDPKLAKCTCSESAMCRDKTCGFYRRKPFDPGAKPDKIKDLGPDHSSVKEIIWTGRDPELLNFKTFTIVHKDLKRSHMVEYDCTQCGEKGSQLARQVRRGIKTRGKTEFFCSTGCAARHNAERRKKIA